MEIHTIALLQVLKEDSLNYQEKRYAMSIIYEAYSNLFTRNRETIKLFKNIPYSLKMGDKSQTAEQQVQLLTSVEE